MHHFDTPSFFYALILSIYWLKWQIKKYGFHALLGFLYICVD